MSAAQVPVAVANSFCFDPIFENRLPAQQKRTGSGANDLKLVGIVAAPGDLGQDAKIIFTVFADGVDGTVWVDRWPAGRGSVEFMQSPRQSLDRVRWQFSAAAS